MTRKKLIKAAAAYRMRGIYTTPLIGKRAFLDDWPSRLMEIDEFANVVPLAATGLGMLCGEPSGHLYDVDLDHPLAVELSTEFLPPTGVIFGREDAPQSHHLYFCPDDPPANAKFLLSEHETIAELRGTGLQTMVPPSRHPSGVDVCWATNGQPLKITGADLLEQLLALVAAVRERAGVEPVLEAVAARGNLFANDANNAPGTAYNQSASSATVGAILSRHGWKLLSRTGIQERWQRPGKEDDGCSATLFGNGTLNVFSTNAGFPCDGEGPPWTFSPFAAYAYLEHGGDFSVAAGALALERGEREQSGINLSGILFDSRGGAEDSTPLVDDPGPIPDSLLNVPGFVAGVMKLTIDSAEYKNPRASFAAALSLQAAICGRKVRAGKTYPNLYLLLLGESGCGKEWPRATTSLILSEAGWTDLIAGSAASGAGLEDALGIQPSLLLAWDEFSTFLASLKRGEQEKMRELLLSLFSAGGKSYTPRLLANHEGRKKKDVIWSPSLTLLATATPDRTFESIDEGSLIDGLISRMILVEASPRAPWSGRSSDPDWDLLFELVAIVRWWRDFSPDGGLVDIRPDPLNVPIDEAAREVEIDFVRSTERERTQCKAKGERVGETLWSRTHEHFNKLALLHACSRSHESPAVDREAAEWAAAFCTHAAKRTLALAAWRVADNRAHAMLQKFLGIVDRAKEISHSRALQKMKCDARSFRDTVDTAIQAAYVERVPLGRQGGGLAYRILSPGGGGKS